MNVNQQKEALLAAYPGSKAWKARVNRMSESQITAIYLRLKAQGKVA